MTSVFKVAKKLSETALVLRHSLHDGGIYSGAARLMVDVRANRGRPTTRSLL